jgi:hypothetical protein
LNFVHSELDLKIEGRLSSINVIDSWSRLFLDFDTVAIGPTKLCEEDLVLIEAESGTDFWSCDCSSSSFLFEESAWTAHDSETRNTPPRPPTVTNTTQLPDTSPLDREGAVSQVDTKSLTTDLSIDKIEKVTDLASPITPTSDRLHTHTDIDSLRSESWQEISRGEGEDGGGEREGEWILA